MVSGRPSTLLRSHLAVARVEELKGRALPSDRKWRQRVRDLRSVRPVAADRDFLLRLHLGTFGLQPPAIKCVGGQRREARDERSELHSLTSHALGCP